ncbi:MAG: regulatory protein RecX [Alphaproteobacteria bacterium]|nr:regulatory protein RecX [Alphaproteobacteria bacterium]
MFPLNNEENLSASATAKRKPRKKITQQRLKNIALYYLKRFESSAANLRNVLHRRVETYARENPDWNKNEAFQWIEDLIADFERLHYLDDSRFAELKINSYLSAGKPARYIKNKLREKGLEESLIEKALAEVEYDPLQMALHFAKRKKIGPYRPTEQRHEFHRKDMAALLRAGFDYDIVCEVLKSESEDCDF